MPRSGPALPLDALTDALATCAGVVGVDSGLSHIAVALDLPHVQIYNFDTAWRTGPLVDTHTGVVTQRSASVTVPVDPHGSLPTTVLMSRLRQCSVFAPAHAPVDAVWQAWLGRAAQRRMALTRWLYSW